MQLLKVQITKKKTHVALSTLWQIYEIDASPKYKAVSHMPVTVKYAKEIAL